MSRRSALWGAAAFTVLLVLLIGGTLMSPALGSGDSAESPPAQVVIPDTNSADLGGPLVVDIADGGLYDSEDDDDEHDGDDHDDDQDSREHSDDEDDHDD